MAEQNISAEARRFLVDHITSVAQLELLLLLRTNPQRVWGVDDLVSELRVEPAWAQQQLDVLRQRGLAERQARRDESEAPTGYRYCPNSRELEQDVTAVAQDFLLHRVSVIEFIYSRPSDTIRAFADAFRLRRGPPHG